MRRFRLKSNIPGYKAGEIFEMRDGSLIGPEGFIVYVSTEIQYHPEIMDWFEEIKDRWGPGEMENYWGIDGCGEVYCFTNHYQGITDNHFAIGNCFRTKEEAEAHLKWLKAVAVLRVDTADQHVLKEASYAGVTVCYSNSTKTLVARILDSSQYSPFMFGSISAANRSINEHRDEWLTFLEVE